MGRLDVLVDVTAFLSTPAIAAVVAGVLGMPGGLAPVTAATVSDALARPAATAGVTSVGSVPSGIPKPFVGPDPVGGGPSIDTLARLDGVTLLDELVALTPAERGEFLQIHPETLTELAASPPAASAVAGWWSRTTIPSRVALAQELPAVVGNLEGVPYAVRDLANRAHLTATVFDIRAQLDAGVGRAMEDELRARLKMLTAVERSLVTGPSGELRRLVSLDVTGQGRAVVSVGDLASADYVSFFVPGMYVGVAEQLVDWTGNAETSLLEQTEWLARLGVDAEVATVAWIGYQTPTIVSVSSFDLAYQGRDALTWSLDGLDAIRGADAPYLTVVAHSYGSTAAMLALQENDVTVDALVAVASPGSPARTVDELKVADGNVWVAAADTDPVPRSGIFGSQPLDEAFGAHRFSVRGTTDPITGEELADIDGHVYYFWPGTTAVRNTALIAIGHGDLATTDTILARASAR